MDIRVDITAAGLDPAALHAALQSLATEAGAIVTFTGVVRPGADGAEVRWLELEHYPGMTESSVQAVAGRAAERWPLSALWVTHRVGRLAPHEPIVMVLAASLHRQAAFEAAAFVMDYLKTEAVFWKREVYADGSARWVESRADDHAAAARWQRS